jgi:ribulose-bisphosphate carboxylase large chain
MSIEADDIVAEYLIESALSLDEVAETIAGEQSSGTFRPVPGETEERPRKLLRIPR